MPTLQSLETKRDLLLAQIARLEAEEQRVTRRYDDLSQHFHLGTVGGSGRNVRKLDQRRERDLERTIERTKVLEHLRGRVFDLNQRISALWGPKPVKQPKPARQRQATALTEREQAIRSWYLYGGADDPPPFPDVTEAEIQQVRKKL